MVRFFFRSRWNLARTRALSIASYRQVSSIFLVRTDELGRRQDVNIAMAMQVQQMPVP